MSQVQIRDETVCVSIFSNAHEKGMNLFFLKNLFFSLGKNLSIR